MPIVIIDVVSSFFEPTKTANWQKLRRSFPTPLVSLPFSFSNNPPPSPPPPAPLLSPRVHATSAAARGNHIFKKSDVYHAFNVVSAISAQWG